MHHRAVTSPYTAVSRALSRLPWVIDRGVQRHVLGRRDHRDAIVMAAAAEPVVSLDATAYFAALVQIVSLCLSANSVGIVLSEQEHRNCHLEQVSQVFAAVCHTLDLHTYLVCFGRPKALNSLNQDMVSRRVCQPAPAAKDTTGRHPAVDGHPAESVQRLAAK